MEKDDFYAINCQNPKKVLLTVRNVPKPNGMNTMVRTCPRISTAVNFSVEAQSGKPISVTCENTSCPFHTDNQDLGVSA